MSAQVPLQAPATLKVPLESTESWGGMSQGRRPVGKGIQGNLILGKGLGQSGLPYS